MTPKDRGRLTVDPVGRWQLYTNTIPEGATPLGTVTRETGETGALVRIERTGIYLQVNAGVTRSLDGRKVAAALGLTGRPSEMTGGKRVNVYLDAASIDAASRIGEGNVSAGIRRAVDAWKT